MSGALPTLFARMAIEHGLILRHRAEGGPQAGAEFVFMVGPEANRFVLQTHREHFSHALGWTPLIGESLGRGLLNMDDPEHARHRKMWNPAFASASMATSDASLDARGITQKERMCRTQCPQNAAWPTSARATWPTTLYASRVLTIGSSLVAHG
jgi:cytochrome P450